MARQALHQAAACLFRMCAGRDAGAGGLTLLRLFCSGVIRGTSATLRWAELVRVCAATSAAFPLAGIGGGSSLATVVHCAVQLTAEHSTGLCPPFVYSKANCLEHSVVIIVQKMTVYRSVACCIC